MAAAPGTRNGRPRGAPALASRFLTGRERDVLRLLVAAESTRGMADELRISRRTVRGHLQSTFTELGGHSRVEAVTYALLHSVVARAPEDDRS